MNEHELIAPTCRMIRLAEIYIGIWTPHMRAGKRAESVLLKPELDALESEVTQ